MFLYLIPLSITILIELTLALIRTSNARFLTLIVVANIITNPAANYIINKYPNIFWTETYPIVLIILAIIIVEWLIYVLFIRKNIMLLFYFSMLANGLSWLFGLLLF